MARMYRSLSPEPCSHEQVLDTAWLMRGLYVPSIAARWQDRCSAITWLRTWHETCANTTFHKLETPRRYWFRCHTVRSLDRPQEQSSSACQGSGSTPAQLMWRIRMA